MFDADTKELRKYEADLKLFAGKAYPYATRATINNAAFDAMRLGRNNLRNEMVLRNAFTERAVQVEKAGSLVVSEQAAVVGGTVKYLNTQEFGGTVHGRGKDQPIATSYAAGQGEGVQPRTRLPRKANLMQSIALQRGGFKTTNRKQRNAAAIRQAAAGGNKFVYLDLGRRRGIFRIIGGRRDPKVKMVWDLSRPSVRIRPRPWLLPAVRGAQEQIPNYYGDALRYQLRLHKVFGY